MKKNTIEIRKAKPSDSNAFLNLVRELAKFERLTPPNPAGSRRLLRDTFETKRLNLLLAFLDKTPVGYALYFFTYSSFLARPTLYLEDLFVLDKFRGKGIGKNLFFQLIKEARKLRCGRMEWSVLTWNSNAIRFYESLGAKKLEEWYFYGLDRKALTRFQRKSLP